MIEDHPPRNSLTIGGSRPDLNEPEGLIHQLKKLPRAMQGQNRVVTPIRYADSVPHKDWELEAAAYKIGEPLNNEHRRQRIELLLKAADGYEKDNQLLAQANVLSLAGLEYCQLQSSQQPRDAGGYERAVELFQRANVIHEKLGHFDHLYRDMDRLYSAALDAARAHRSEGNQPRADVYIALAEDVVREIPAIAARMQGPEDTTAHCVGEGQIGFSADEPIGTYNVGQCSILIAQRARSGFSKNNPHPTLTGIAHVDFEVKSSSLDSYFEPFPEGPLKLRILGARFESDPKSFENLRRIFRAIMERNRKHDIEVISADIGGNEYGKSTVVVNPKTFELKEAVPAKENPYRHLGDALPMFCGPGELPLTVSVDLVKSDYYAPVLLDRKRVAMLRNDYLDRDLLSMDDAMQKVSLSDRALTARYMYGLNGAYKEAYGELEDILNKRVRALQCRQSGRGDVKTVERAYQLLQYAPLYVGINAYKANRPVRDAIEDLLKKQETDIELFPERLEELHLSPHAHSALFSGRVRKSKGEKEI